MTHRSMEPENPACIYRVSMSVQGVSLCELGKCDLTITVNEKLTTSIIKPQNQL